MGKFHAQQELFFERLEEGKVEITFPNSERVTLNPEAWASVVASMSARGEDSNTYYEALTFHSKEE